MKRLASFVVLAAVMLPAGLAAHSGADAPAAQKSGCDTIKLGEPRIFYKHNMRCSKAKSYARRVYRSDGRDEPRRFTCESGSNFDEGGSCRHETKNKYFGWHPAD
jgi:hypothetical protein